MTKHRAIGAPEASKELEELKRTQADLEAQLAALRAKIESLDESAGIAADAAVLHISAPRSRIRAVRDTVLDALDDLGFAAYSQELSGFCNAWFGRKIPPSRFGSLGSDEVEAYQTRLRSNRSPRLTWLGFALTYDRFEPIKRLWVRSDWPLEDRILAPSTGRVQHLRLTVRLCELAQDADTQAADPEMLRIIAADHARGLPGTKVVNGKFPLGEWRDTALEHLARLEADDLAIRREAAQRLSKEAELVQLFGRPEVIDQAPVRRIQRGS